MTPPTPASAATVMTDELTDELVARIAEAAEIGAFNGWANADLMAHCGQPPVLPDGFPAMPPRYHVHPDVAAAYVDAYREQFVAFLDDRAKY